WLNRLAAVGIGAFLLLFVAGMLLSWLPGGFAWSGQEPEVLIRLGRTLLWGGMVVALMASGLLFWGWHAEQRRLPALRDRSIRFAASLANVVRQLGSSLEETLGERAEHYLVGRKVLMPPAQAAELDAQVQERLRQFDGLPERVRLFEADPASVGLQVPALMDDLERHNTALDGFVRVLDQDVVHEQTLVEQYQGLNQGLTDREAEARRHHHTMRVQDMALTLVQRASEHSAARFNSIVHKRCQALLADFTQAHYDSLEINTDFALRVLSREKGDFLDFEEISAGTQRQIALAMRVALANALAESTDAGQQLLFLDEPFAFFDPERTSATLQSLKEMTDGRVCQIWVTVQSVLDGMAGAYLVYCDGTQPEIAMIDDSREKKT
ncbi:MAG TPA: hypothetical protein PLN94_16170, partial [Thiolinea sp.]|nr:hypothetical protein [Thiolinea sp.]